MAYSNLAETYIALRRRAEARRTIEDAFARNIDEPELHRMLFQLALVDGDRATIDAQRAWAARNPAAFGFALSEAELLAAGGHLKDARAAFGRITDSASSPLVRDRVRARWAVVEAAVGENARAHALIASIDKTKPTTAALDAMFAAGLAGDRAAADSLTPAVPAIVPVIALNAVANAKTLLDLQRGQPDALSRIRPPAGGELIANGPALRPIYLRALAYLHGGAADLAIAEFTRVIEHPETVPESPIHALSRLGIARAFVLEGSQAKAAEHYRDFFARWKDADPDVPVLLQARAEYAKLATSK